MEYPKSNFQRLCGNDILVLEAKIYKTKPLNLKYLGFVPLILSCVLLQAINLMLVTPMLTTGKCIPQVISC